MTVRSSNRMMVRTRFAPSPSGHLHVGGARTALYCRAFAHAHGGKFVLRIEDTDVKRSSDAASMGFLDDLKWLGLEWDEGPEYEGVGGGEYGPYFQSQRLETYDRYIDQLLAEGKAYCAFETAEELDAARAEARELKREYRYRDTRAALQLDERTIQQYLSEGRPHVVRFKTPDGTTTIHDQVVGDVAVENEKLDDFVIRKADGYPTYHFAVVVDDELMQVTHILRAQEHLYNTPRHILLQDALGFRRPVYGHLSLITNQDGSKMSKRDKDKTLRAFIRANGIESLPEHIITPERRAWWLSDKDHQLDLDEASRLAAHLNIDLPEINVDDFRRSGYLPHVLLRYLMLLGWSPGAEAEAAEGKSKEEFDVEYLTRNFDLTRLSKSPAKFDREKLLSFNLSALQSMSPEEFERAVRAHAESYHRDFLDKMTDAQFSIFARSNQERSKTLDDPFRSCRFFILPDDEIEYEQSKAVRKALENGEPSGYDILEQLSPVLRDVITWEAGEIERALKQFADAHSGGVDGKFGRVGQPLRIAITGGTISPSLFETLEILGRESVLNRIKRCLALRLHHADADA